MFVDIINNSYGHWQCLFIFFSHLFIHSVSKYYFRSWCERNCTTYEDVWSLTKARATVHAQSLSRVWLFATPWPVARQAPLSMVILQAGILEWTAMPSSRGSSQSRDRTHVSCIAGRFFTVWATREALLYVSLKNQFVKYNSLVLKKNKRKFF